MSAPVFAKSVAGETCPVCEDCGVDADGEFVDISGTGEAAGTDNNAENEAGKAALAACNKNKREAPSQCQAHLTSEMAQCLANPECQFVVEPPFDGRKPCELAECTFNYGDGGDACTYKVIRVVYWSSKSQPTIRYIALDKDGTCVKGGGKGKPSTSCTAVDGRYSQVCRCFKPPKSGSSSIE